jgi:hypothetical protein
MDANLELLLREHNYGSPEKSGSPSGKESVIDNTRRTKSSPGDDGILYSVLRPAQSRSHI